jgi:hypothetical protein
MPPARSLRNMFAPSDSTRYFGPLERQRADSAVVINAARRYLDNPDESKSVDLANEYAAAERNRYGTMFSTQAAGLPEYQGEMNQARRGRDSTQFVNNAAFQRMTELSDARNKAYQSGAQELSRERAGLPDADANKVYVNEQQKILEALGVRLRPRK